MKRLLRNRDVCKVSSLAAEQGTLKLQQEIEDLKIENESFRALLRKNNIAIPNINLLEVSTVDDSEWKEEEE